MEADFEKEAPKASVFVKTRAQDCPDSMHSQLASTGNLSKIKAELGFEQNMKVVGFFEIYKFNEEKFFKF